MIAFYKHFDAETSNEKANHDIMLFEDFSQDSSVSSNTECSNNANIRNRDSVDDQILSSEVRRNPSRRARRPEHLRADIQELLK